MQLRVIAAVAAAFVFVATTSADARRYRAQTEQSQSYDDDEDRPVVRRKRASEDAGERRSNRRSAERSSRRHSDDDGERGGRHSGVGARPGAWCGWYMRTRHGGGPEMNLAANWRRYGSPGSPQVGAIVVWPHHVGEIVGRAGNGQWIVLSGNDGGQVRRRPRSISGAVVRI